MDPLTSADVEYIARLAYIKLSDEETEDMRVQLSNILGHFASLSTVETDGVEATGHTTDSNTVMRKDEPQPPLDQDDVLRNAPDRDGEFVRVRPVLE
ncbi:MAG: Asp-tRNA(Asn)/Glu-tRNA(Gln) amidotransferase subunit GatC [Dehalococcoidia bacterium]|jgi:aspartyl-tRNA(Asn)/glutamyl-tRNA(Gln) amidotransferase subunit C|nr:Asp-tRNA(Asn)/Glu-tRNA(Gln) amidotransferase GatCAB subunit C [Chloroflexota bacterium]MDP7090373.1 Asp-tRNA(Asn)/Glu-tRNA(Gln) amidotransferase subunit GatC [Dehalococcoidia bacterium]MDP7261316.1 Asp-tRNA(Asn)/Glu-tRNA(Gln) amidotransferase subunit GatC [Dehalococcoidia bacterium]MDP7486292.1 Asp-tRNA(Asn)/Glu-tRNA(Gln) amidotransferase subunit GatC [Dehalococcoidia bacterium]|tara:strand:- start:21409 stop:21699 length:291 start_codon:yes stop_codon:yes gene_type:complete